MRNRSFQGNGCHETKLMTKKEISEDEAQDSGMQTRLLRCFFVSDMDVSGCSFVSSHLSSESPAVSSESVELNGKTSYDRLIKTKENFISVRSTNTLKI